VSWTAEKLAHWALFFPLGLAIAARRPSNTWTTWTIE
jgi:hypothetical protein